VSVRSRNEAERAVIEVVDDGVGLPESFSVEENRRLGLNIARTLVQVDLRGTLDLIRGEEGGTIVRIAFVPSGAPDQ
jgi:two-component sensor histidine kinase